MTTTTKITDQFGANLATLLAEKIKPAYPAFPDTKFINTVEMSTEGKTYTQRIEIIADALHTYLPTKYSEALSILISILGPENPHETGMFTHFYWIMPIGKFVEKYGLDHFDTSMNALEEITKRNTAEYAVRPFIRKYPAQSLARIQLWAQSDNFHLRRLASEGLRPKLPWASKLDVFIAEPQPVFEILTLLNEDSVKFVQKSVANHLTDYLKVNPMPTRELIGAWRKSDNKYTQWIIKHATRKIS